MKDKFIVVDCMGIKQVGFDGAMGVSVLDVEQIVQMMNGFNNTCERLEKHIKGTTKALEVCGERIEELENELTSSNKDRDYLLNKVVDNIITDWD
tara:strand:+ start:42575 stop:42859 length:285 start_codon:yes stop_codon:yes gene_type:complete